MKPSDCTPYALHLLRAAELLRAFPDDALRTLAAHCRIRHCRRHEMLAKRGQPFEGLVLVAEGAIQSSTFSEDGREIVFSVVRAGHVWGVVAVLDGEGAVHDTYTCSASTLVIIPSVAIHRLLDERPELYRCFNRMLCYRLRKAYSSVNEYGLSSLRQRLARQLCILSESAAPGGVRQSIHTTQEQLASLVGATRPRVNRELAALQNAGVISVHYGEITVLQYEKLQALCSAERMFYL